MNRSWIPPTPLLVLLAVTLFFATQSPRFVTAQNGINLLLQTASAAVLAAGMSFVLLTSGIDLSVGSLMFLCAATGGKLIQLEWPLSLAIVVMLLVGPICGWMQGLIITRAGLSPFIVTMASLFLLRGGALWITRTRAINLPDALTQWSSSMFWGLPYPVWTAAGLIGYLHWLLTRTSFGRQTMAVGHHPESARKAGINVSRILIGVYVLSGLCASVASFLSLVQLGAVSPTFGRDREFDAIAAAVLGGTSLFGGRGNIFPGAVYGSLTIAIVFNGLNTIDANPHIYPIITGSVILLAVLMDATRRRTLNLQNRH